MESEGFTKLPKDFSEESLASIEDSSLKEKKVDPVDDFELPSDIEEVEVEGLKEHLDDEWMDIIGSGDLKKKVIVAGIVDSRPVKGDTVCIELTTKLSDGTLVQDAHNVTFTVGDCEVIQGLDLVVPLMDNGEKSEVYMAARFAYGSKGEEGLVPADSSLLCTVSLLDYKPEETPDSLDVSRRKAVGNRKRMRGNWWFNRGDFAEAVQCYKAAVDFLDDTDELSFEQSISSETKQLLEERLKALNNMAAAQIKLEAFDAALASVSSVLQCQPDNVKALYREAKALEHKGQLNPACISLSKALVVEPNNKAVQQELSRLSVKVKEQEDKEKSLYRRMLGVKEGAADAKKTDSRYSTLSLAPFKVFFQSFLAIVFALVVYQYSDDILRLLS